MDTYKRHALWAVPLLFLLLVAPFSGDLDLFVAKSTYYHNWDAVDTGEHGFFSTPFFDWVYLYAVLPAHITCVVAGICLILSKWFPNLRRFRGSCIVICLTLLIGSLFITHTLFKEHWGRPRPRQIVQFGGQQTFRAFYQPLFNKAPEPSKSFPSGHSTCGFFFFFLYFLGRRYNNRTLARLGVGLGIVLGGALSVARIVQGGHFISDAYIAALIMWLTAYYCDYLVFEAPLFSRLRRSLLDSDPTLENQHVRT